MKILNGRTLGDLMGKYTYVGYNGLSTVDYVLGSENLLMKNQVHSFEVEELTLLSDHRPLCLTLQHEGNKRKQKEDHITKCTPKKNKILIKDYGSYEMNLRTKMNKKYTESMIQRLKHITTKNESASLNNIIGEISDLYVTSADTFSHNHVKIDKVKCKQNKSKKAWFTKDCRTLKRKLNQMRKILDRNPDKENARKLFYKTQKQYKKLVKLKRRQFEQNITSKLEYLYSHDKNTFWKYLKSMKGLKNAENENLPQLDRLITHFQNLYYKEDLKDNITNLENLEQVKNPNDKAFYVLSKEINEEEVRNCIKSMKNNKSPGHDQILNEMIKCTNKEGIILLTKLFNTILSCGYFPKDWNYGLLRLIHKDGDTDDENNYRAITLNSCLGKLFCTILNQRLYTLLEQENIFCKEQAGFRKNYRTTDQIFLLKNIIKKYIYPKISTCTHVLWILKKLLILYGGKH